MEWIDVNDRLPEEDELVWLYSLNTKSIYLGCRVYVNNQGWFWACLDSWVYCYKGKIDGECSIDDLDVTHWMPLPKLPENG